MINKQFIFSLAVLPGSKGRLLDINTGVALVTLHFQHHTYRWLAASLMGRRRKIVFPSWHQSRGSPAVIHDPGELLLSSCAGHSEELLLSPTNWYYRHYFDYFLSLTPGDKNIVCPWHGEIYSISKTSKHHQRSSASSSTPGILGIKQTLSGGPGGGTIEVSHLQEKYIA